MWHTLVSRGRASKSLKALVANWAGTAASLLYAQVLGSSFSSPAVRFGMLPVAAAAVAVMFQLLLSNSLWISQRKLGILVGSKLPAFLSLDLAAVALVMLLGGPGAVTAFYLVTVPMLFKGKFMDMATLWANVEQMKRYIGL